LGRAKFKNLEETFAGQTSAIVAILLGVVWLVAS
jgi:hypothetical protein